MKNEKRTYHHGNLAESLLTAVDEIASQFGLEAVTLRACAKRVGVSPSSAFRHYADKKSLLTAFATRALKQLSTALQQAAVDALVVDDDPFEAVGMAYITFALDKPAFFRAMWREETIYTADAAYSAATEVLSNQFKAGFAATLEDHNPEQLSAQELLAWSAVHGLANLFVEGPIGKQQNRQQKLSTALEMLRRLSPALNEST